RAALDVFTRLERRQGPGLFTLGAIPNLGVDVARLERLVDEEIERLVAEGITERELRKAKNRRRAAEVGSRTRVLSKGDLLQLATLRFGTPFAANEEYERYERVTLADVERVARTYLTRDNRTVVIAE